MGHPLQEESITHPERKGKRSPGPFRKQAAGSQGTHRALVQGQRDEVAEAAEKPETNQ